MAIRKCPRCELNYLMDGEKICSVCRREVRGEPEQDEMVELCTECGEHPAVPGGELCLYCLKELARHSDPATDDPVVVHEEALGGIDSVSTMDEIALDIDDDIANAPFADDAADEFADEDDEDLDEDEDADDEDDEDENEDDEEIIPKTGRAKKRKRPTPPTTDGDL